MVLSVEKRTFGVYQKGNKRKQKETKGNKKKETTIGVA
jgi:hypothetical protein